MKKKSKMSHVPIIFLTAKTDSESIIKAFEAGGSDYLPKPFNSAELLARIKTHLKLKTYEDDLYFQVQKLTQEIENTQKEVVFTMGAIGETRSKETGQHVQRVAEYSKLLAIAHGLSENDAELLKQASPMHDIGKVAIPDQILNKPGPLDADEWLIMKTHAEIGFEMLKHSNRPLLKTASIVASQHHERWDGFGYPNNLKEENIHIFGRITAIADVFDALSADRVYKKAWHIDEILDLFKKERAKQFDPNITDIFFENLELILKIKDEFKDEICKVSVKSVTL
jgi:response regulator RpfG family c-di-GMP phosphodiesterase